MARAKSKKKDTLTPRQRQSQQIMREKAARKRREAFLHKLAIASSVLLGIGVLAAGVWMWRSGAVERTAQQMSDGIYAMTVHGGYGLQTLYLEGRNRTPMDAIEEAIGVKKGDPILRVSLSEIRERLEKIDSIRFAAVERELPGTLSVHIVEREPVALWQNKGKVALVDDNGVAMKDVDTAKYPKLPLIVGEKAPEKIGELLTILASDADLAQHFDSAIRISARRWNIRLSGGVEIKLPEDKPEQAWRMLAELNRKQRLLERNIKVIDLRLQDRFFITLPPEESPNRASRAKET
ncbi:MAG: cell division protein FtsQ/DivIB [Rickettsiales bacterium]|nr:cell division protein FtsQ/DivIB [Rickettsiales bacterium]